MMAIGHKEILQLLIESGANLNAVDRNGRTALDAALGAYESEGKFENQNVMPSHSFFLLKLLARFHFYIIGDSKGREEVVRLLMENGAERGGIVNLTTISELGLCIQ